MKWEAALVVTNLQRILTWICSALRSFKASFSSLFSCPAHNFAIFVHSCCSHHCRPQLKSEDKSMLCLQLFSTAPKWPKKKTVIAGSIDVKQTWGSQSAHKHPHSPEDRSDQPVTHVGVQPEYNTDGSSVHSESLCNNLVFKPRSNEYWQWWVSDWQCSDNNINNMQCFPRVTVGKVIQTVQYL